MRGIGKRIREIREARGMSLNALARRAGVAPANVSRLENEHQSVKIETLEALVRALGLTIGEFFGADVSALPHGIRIPLLCLSQVPDYLKYGMETMEVSPIMIEVPEIPGAEKYLALHIKDVSMQGRARDYFRPGEVVIIDPNTRPEPGDYVLAIVDSKAIFRQFKLRQDHIELAPLNNFWPTVSVPEDDVIIIGVMVEHRRYRRVEENSPVSYAAYCK